MFRAHDVAAGGLRMHQQYLDVTGNNVANVNSDGFKASRIMFEDALSQLARGTGITPAPQPNGAINAAMIGLGVARRGVDGDFAQGAFTITNLATDLGVSGDGYFVLQGANGPVYTRNGNFSFDAAGVLRAGDGKAVLGADGGPITLPAGPTAGSLAVTAQGQIVLTQRGGAGVAVGQIQLARFATEAGLLRVGNSQFQATAASGAAVTGVSGQNGLGSLVSGVTEGSNVDLGAELTNLVMAQRGFQANSRVLSTADELADRINQMQ